MNRRQFLAGLGAAAAIAPIARFVPVAAKAAPVIAVDTAGGPDAAVVYWFNSVFFQEIAAPARDGLVVAVET